MRRLAAALLLAAAASAHGGASVLDATGREIRLAQPARRIATLSPALTEAVFAAGAGRSVVGVSAWSDYPPEATRLPVVSSSAGADVEAIARLAPDLVLAWRDSFRPADAAKLAALGIPVFVDGSRTLADIAPLLESIGRLADVDAAPAARRYRETLAALRARYASRRAVPVFLEISHRPLMTVSGPHFMVEALETCGARSVFASLPDVAPVIGWEALHAADPDAIVGAGSAQGEAAFRAAWRERPTLRAVKAGKLAWVGSSALGRPSPRVVEGIAALCEAIERLR